MTIAWEAVEGAQQYRVEVGELIDGAERSREPLEETERTSVRLETEDYPEEWYTVERCVEAEDGRSAETAVVFRLVIEEDEPQEPIEQLEEAKTGVNAEEGDTAKEEATSPEAPKADVNAEAEAPSEAESSTEAEELTETDEAPKPEVPQGSEEPEASLQPANNVPRLQTASRAARAVELKITKQPEDASAPDGEVVRVTVEAEGENLTYEWWYALAGSTKFYKSSITTATYSTRMDATRDGRQLYCVVKDESGNSVQSDTVTISLQKAELKITKQPEDAIAPDGELVRVTVEAEGESLTYEWWYALAGSTKFYKSSITTATYSTRMDATRDGRQLYCIVKDESGNSVQSDTVTISLQKAELKITKQPEDAIAPDGELVRVTVEAEGESLTYEWWYALAGSTKFYKSSITTATYSTRMDVTRDGRQLYCVVKDESGNSVQSDTVTISLQKAELKITKQPEDAMALDGELVHVTVEAEGENLTYEWWYATPGSTKFYKSSITTATYSTRMDATRDGRQLYCIVKDENGNSIQSDTVTISLQKAELKITKQPEDAIAPDGELVRVTVEAEGESLTYEWWYATPGSTKFYKSSITTATYSTRMDAARDGRQLYCVVKDENGNSIQSDTVTISVTPPILITQQPEDVSAKEGTIARVSVSAEGEGLTYEWWYSPAGSTKFYQSTIRSSTYATSMDATRDGRRVYCVISDAKGHTAQTETATLRMIPAVLITRQPEDAHVNEGDMARVTVEAEGEGLTYEWWYSPAGSKNFYKSSVTTATYATPMDETRDGRRLYCVITDKEGHTAQTETVTLHMIPALVITRQPEGATVADGDVARVFVEATGDGLTYEWWYAQPDDEEFSKSSLSTATYSAPMDALRDGRRLYCIVSDAYGNSVKSDTVTMNMAVGASISDFSYRIINDECIIGAYNGAGGEIHIPSQIEGVKVVRINQFAFDNSNLTSVTVPEGISNIEKGTFRNCNSLTSVTLPESITSIGANAFYSCASLTSIELPKGVKSIGEYAFAFCDSLTSVTLPEGVTSVADGMFSGCVKLASVTLAKGTTSIGGKCI